MVHRHLGTRGWPLHLDREMGRHSSGESRGWDTGAVWVDARQEMVKNFFRACVPLRHSGPLFLFLPVPGKALSKLIDDKPRAVAAVAPAHHVRRAVDLRPDRPIRPLGEAARHLGESAVLVSADGDAAPVLAAQLRRRYLAAHVAADQGWRAAIARQEAQRVERLGEIRVRGEAAAGAVLDPLVLGEVAHLRLVLRGVPPRKGRRDVDVLARQLRRQELCLVAATRG
mmetsp:Transcript_45135/g.148040  ORF Transcript_45135/g.148040 Transcript_45135/m.148040 type:complete len:227 (-) Transcript_45135:224-904(-)